VGLVEEIRMPDWLIQHDKIPPLTLDLIEGGTLT